MSVMMVALVKIRVLLIIMRMSIRIIDQQEVGVVSTTVLSIVYTCADVCKQ